MFSFPSMTQIKSSCRNRLSDRRIRNNIMPDRRTNISNRTNRPFLEMAINPVRFS
jgi:hypothetical protein